MKNREMGMMFRILATLFVSTIIVIGCATQESSEMESIGRANAPVERDGLEEIVVTGVWLTGLAAPVHPSRCLRRWHLLPVTPARNPR